MQKTCVELVTNIKGVDDPKLASAFDNPRLAILGHVWNKVDDITDSMQLKTAGLHNQVRLWAQQGQLNGTSEIQSAWKHQ